MASEMAARGRTALVFRGDDGLDELTTTADSKIWQVSGGEVREFTLDPTKFGLKRASLEQLIGGDAQENAEVTNRLFAGELSGNFAAIRDIVVLNAAGGVVAYELAKDASRAEVDLDLRFEDAILRVSRALESGAAQAKLTEWIAATQK
jgi:anthranilate phosphoribosyltransferase